MTVALFIAVLVVLIVVHELGHFIVAKLSGMRVDEFGIGFPPKLYGKKIGETEYTINALPLGGFVRIHGEDISADGGDADPRSFSARPRILQALTLVAGVTMNWLLAFVLISATLVMGTPRALTAEEAATATDATLMVAEVMPESPAAAAGLVPGDTILSVSGGANAFTSSSPDAFVAFVGEQESGVPLTVTVERNGEVRTIEATPQTGVVAAAPDRTALGLSVATVATLPVPLWRAPIEGFALTWEVTKQTAVGLGSFFASAATLSADLSQVAGPVGIAGVVGNAYQDGLAPLLTIAAIISINLAIINLLPLPALDGGRLVFVIIEAITRRPIPPRFAATVNGVSFALLILLMVVVTVSDVMKLL